MTFGENLKRLRRDRFLSRAALAERSGISQQSIWRYEAGLAAPLGRTVLALAEALGVQPLELAAADETAEVRWRGKSDPVAV